MSGLMTGTTTITTVPAVPVQELQLVAENADAMAQCQQRLVGYFEQKEAEAAGDAAELEQEIEIARREGWRTAALRRQATLAVKRQQFYEKCRVAVEAGYVIVPNMPCDVFAVRTNQDWPDPRESDWSNATHEQRSESPPAGEGEYKSDQPTQRQFTAHTTTATGESKQVKRYEADDWQDVEFPVSIAKPQIMTAAARAMALKCFDELAVIPNRRNRKGDPLLLGIVRHPQRGDKIVGNRQVTFLIAWYVDTRLI